MIENSQILFSKRFQSVYEWLGIFSYMYVAGLGRGIDKDVLFMEQSRSFRTGTVKILPLLMDNNIIIECNGLLHLNRRLFFEMNIWDLLLICEPWLNRSQCESKKFSTEEKMIALEQMARSENLSDMYTSYVSKLYTTTIPEYN